ncbi:putative AgrB-like protein [Gottschalkia acidurici 9a]|uniref:AgrB-like protein n=1 Tax=Gottschalkia acidurici (strain ATCC 7906 / DSM 604 / BCRC 14475 / CIP 104303 / KCTC 5404 / NCIMB 10678 / 9a) TaxID=1128398 RepID=K0AX04_GOTA9|nr:accessory gene regulator B family protein [Gottschalkia acidurici]AFS77312.1 putative AgrB-like protein [Gottschalkia acidurici 9a]
MSRVVKKIANDTYEFSRGKYSKEDWIEILEYMFHRMTVFTLFILSLAILIYIFKLDMNIYVFTGSFLLLRAKFGGVHLESELLCFVASVIFPFSVYFFFKDIHISKITILSTYLISALILFKLGTIDNKNRQLTIEAKKRFKKQGMIVLTILLIINIFTLNKFITLSVIFTVLSCIAGKIRNREKAEI